MGNIEFDASNRFRNISRSEGYQLPIDNPYNQWQPFVVMKYHKSYNWIIPVTVKIFALLSDIKVQHLWVETNDSYDDFYEDLLYSIRDGDIAITNEKCVEFIEWHNSQ